MRREVNEKAQGFGPAASPGFWLKQRMVAGELLEHEPMRRHVTWRAGGTARFAYAPLNRADLVRFIAANSAQLANYPAMYVGLGSNLLIRDGGYPGTVVFVHGALNDLQIEADQSDSLLVYAEAGVAAPKLSRFAATHGMGGGEFFSGVPGTVGGALAMNAGCYGSETWELVESVETIDARGTVRVRPAGDFRIGYRSVALQGPQPDLCGEWFLGAHFRFRKGSGDLARLRIRELLAKRVASQPLNLPNAGSVFRNPPGDHAARLIESCGLKGKTIGGARVSEKHANFIVNPGGAGSAQDIETLMLLVQATVVTRTGVLLEPEVRIIGVKEAGI